MMQLSSVRAQGKKAIESLYEHNCTISRNEKHKDPITKQTKYVLVEKHTNIPCKVSKKGLSSNNQTDTVNSISHEIKLFISPDVEILQGDEITVNQLGFISQYTSGDPFRYSTHQEIVLSKKDNA